MDIFSYDLKMFASKFINTQTSTSEPMPQAYQPERKVVVRRCLFGPPTPEERWEVRRTLRELEAREIDRMSEKYNFDIRTSTPLPGRYDWEETDSDENIVRSARDSKHETIEQQVELSLDKNTESLARNDNTAKSMRSSKAETSSTSSSIMLPRLSSQLSLSSSSTLLSGERFVVRHRTTSSENKAKSSPIFRKRRNGDNLQITDFYPVCKKVRFSKRESREY